MVTCRRKGTSTDVSRIKDLAILLKKGRHGLLIQAAVCKPYNDWGKIFMTPHLLDVDEKARQMLKQYAEDKSEENRLASQSETPYFPGSHAVNRETPWDYSN